jgi:hypothetical protein
MDGAQGIREPNAAPPTHAGTSGYCNDYTHRHVAFLEWMLRICNPQRGGEVRPLDPVRPAVFRAFDTWTECRDRWKTAQCIQQHRHAQAQECSTDISHLAA